MNTWECSKIIIIIMLLFFSCKKETKQSTTTMVSKPNVIYILTDQWRGSALGYAGNPDVKTPNLDRFSKQSVNFTNAVSVLPVCTPHRASLLTGRFPTTTGMILNDLYLPKEELTMAEIYKEAGYNTAYWGKWHLDGHGRHAFTPKERRQGFEYWKALECSHNYKKMPYYDHNDSNIKYWKTYSPFAIVEDVNKYLVSQANAEKPFLAMISIATPHFPHDSAPEAYKAMYPVNTLTLNPNVPKQLEKRTRKELQGYYAHATATDEALGALFKQIEHLNLLENTIIVFSADHGEMMGAHGVRPWVKQMAWNESISVPFLIHYPGTNVQKEAVVNAPITTPDILPTLLDLSGIKIPTTIEGENLSNLVKKPNAEHDRAALVMNVAPFASNFKDEPYRAIRTKQYTYARTIKGPSMLFDNLADPYQMNNLLNKSNSKDIQAQLDKKMNDKLTSIGDEFKSRDYYLKKYNYTFAGNKPCIAFWKFDNGTGVVYSPKNKEH